MENILPMVEGPKPTQVTSIEQIDQETMQEFLGKSSVWDFHEMTRDEYMNKAIMTKKIQFYRFLTICLQVTFCHLFLCFLEFDFLLFFHQ